MFLFSLTPRRNKLTIIFLWNKSMFFLLESSLSLSQTSVKPRILQQNSLKILEKSSLFTVFPCSSLIFHVFSLFFSPQFCAAHIFPRLVPLCYGQGTPWRASSAPAPRGRRPHRHPVSCIPVEIEIF